MGIHKPTAFNTGSVVKSTGEDQTRCLAATQAELDSLRAMGTLRKVEMQEATSVQTKGAPTVSSKIVFVMKPGTSPLTVKHEARLVVCGHFLPQLSETAAHNLDIIAIR